MRAASNRERRRAGRAWWASLEPGQRRTLVAMALVVAGLHGLGFAILIAVAGPRHPHVGAAGALTIGIGVTAYTLGLRHAFDADHISAIDNTTRKLMGEGKRPLSVGFWFSLGHSTIVFALAFLISRRRAGARRPGQATAARSCTHVTSIDRDARLRRVPVPDRRAERGDPGRDPQGLPRDAQRPLRRARSSSASSTAAG